MKNMLFVPAALAATLLFGPSMLAQAAPTTSSAMQAKYDQRLNHVAEALSLTDAQKAQMKTIAGGAVQQIMAVRSDSTLSVDAKRAKVKAIQETAHDQMKAILTPAQKDKFKQMQKMQKGAAK